MPKLSLTVSDAVLSRISALAERDSPGAPNLSATTVRLLAVGLRAEYRGDTSAIVARVEAELSEEAPAGIRAA